MTSKKSASHCTKGAKGEAQSQELVHGFRLWFSDCCKWWLLCCCFWDTADLVAVIICVERKT